jgi:hypothetical protein
MQIMLVCILPCFWIQFRIFPLCTAPLELLPPDHQYRFAGISRMQGRRAFSARNKKASALHEAAIGKQRLRVNGNTKFPVLFEREIRKLSLQSPASPQVADNSDPDAGQKDSTRSGNSLERDASDADPARVIMKGQFRNEWA